MMKASRKWCCAAILGSLASFGCSSSVDAPGDVPVYESSTVFAVEGPGSVGEPGIGNGEDHPSNNPLYSGGPTRQAAVVGQRLVAFPGADYSAPLPYRASRGVLVYSLEDATAPELMAELPVAGSALQMVAGTDYVAMVARVPRQVELSEIPTTPLFNDATQLMRLDLGDASEPRLSAGIELDGDFWQAVEHDGYLFVLSQVRRAQQGCEGYETSSAATTETMRVSSYRFDGASYELVDQQDLPGDGYAAFGAEAGFVSVLGNYDEEPTLSVASFSSAGQITVSAPVAIAGPVTAVNLSGTSLAVATLAEDAAQLALYDLEDASTLSERWSRPLPRAAYRLSQTELLSEPVILGDGWIVRADGTDVSLPEGMNAYQLIAVSSDALLAAERDDAGKVSLSSLTATAPLSLTRTSLLATEWPALDANSAQNSGPFTWEATTKTLYYSYTVFDGQTTGSGSYVGVARLSDGTLQARGEVLLATHFGQPLVDEQGAHFVGSDGAQHVSADSAPSAGPYLPFFGPGVERVVARRDTEVGEFRLVQRDGRMVLQYPERAGERPEEELPHFASELVVTSGAIAAAGLYWNEDCGRDLEIPELELGCPVPRQRGITFVTLSEPPGPPRTLAIDDALDAPALPAHTEQTTSWFGYVIHGDRLLLPVTRLIRCNTVEACDTLGLPWYTSYASPGCNPQLEDCETKSNEPMQLVQGYGRESLLYVLDPATASGFGEPLRFGDGVDFQGTLITPRHEDGGPLDLSAMILQAGDLLGFPTDEPAYNSEGNSISNEHGEALHRFGVELVRAGSEGEVTHQASVNTPGRVVAMADEGAVLYSLAPSHVDSQHITALLHRLKVTERGATIQRSLDLGSGFRDALSRGPRVHFLFGPETHCYRASPDRETSFFSVDIAAGARGPSLTLPWEGWSFDRSGAPGDASVLLSGGPAGYRGRAEIDVSGTEPEVAQYFTVAP